jgi:hypothetical protein
VEGDRLAGRPSLNFVARPPVVNAPLAFPCLYLPAGRIVTVPKKMSPIVHSYLPSGGAFYEGTAGVVDRVRP